MKHFLYSAIAVLMGLFATSCVQEDNLAIFDPSEIKTQTLSTITGCTLSAEGEAIAITFNKADFGLEAASAYSLYAAVSGTDLTPMEKVNCTISHGNITVAQKDLNNTILNLGGLAETEFTLDFVLAGYLINDKNAEIAGSRVLSNVVTATFIPYKADRFDVDIFDHVWIIGASTTVGAWAHDKVYQYLYDYNKDGKTYNGVIDFGEDGASGGWKITGEAGWNDDCNWGSEAQAETEEQLEIQLITGSGSKDIKCLSKRFYSLKFDKTTLLLNVLAGWNNVGIAGSFNDWNAADESCKMTYNDAYHRFWIDYTFAEDSEIKFAADDAWTLDWGADCKAKGDNIKVNAGSYRVYLDFNNSEITFNDKMFGKEEPGRALPPEEPFKGWSLIGTLGESNWDADFDMTDKGEGIFFYNGIEITEETEFKIREDHEWAVAYGATADATIAVDTPFAATTDNGLNIKLGIAGKYDITLDTNANTILIATHIENLWSLIGVNGNWENDIDMTEVMPGIWVSPKTNITETGWKLRMGKDWAVNRGCNGLAADGKFVKAVQGGGNIELTGDIIVVYNANADAIGTLVWGLVGSIASIDGFSWNGDVPMNLGSDGKFYSIPVALTTADEFKIRYMAAWAVDRGGACETAETAFEAIQGGANIKAPADGTYMVVYDPTAETITLTKEYWGLIGDFNGWSSDRFMINQGSGLWCAYNQAIEGGWKIRKSADWAVSVGGVFASAGVEFDAVSDNGPNITVTDPDFESFDITYNTATEKILIN